MNKIEEDFKQGLVWESVKGQVVSKSNNYMAVPDGQGGRRIIKSDKMRRYERSFARQCHIYRGKLIDRPFILHIVVYESSWANDLDNAFKGVLDCLQAVGAITNDNLCIGIHARKAIDPRNPHIVFAIEQTEPLLFTN